MMRRGLFNLWTSPSCTTTMKTSDSPFMEDYSSEDYDDDYDVVPNNEPIIECYEVVALEVPDAVGTEEGEEVEAPIASLPLSITMVQTSDSNSLETTTVPPFHQCPEYLREEMFLSSAALFVLQECRTTVKNWIERFLSQLERIRVRFYSALRALIRKSFIWASHKFD